MTIEERLEPYSVHGPATCPICLDPATVFIRGWDDLVCASCADDEQLQEKRQ